MIETLAVVLLVALDQLVKYLVKTNIPLGAQMDFIPHVLGLTHIHNNGAAFSMLSGARWFFVILTIARWTLVLIIAGAVGNLIDRAVYGYVVDMFEVLFMRFAIFNMADIFIVVGGILFCIYYGFLHDKHKKQPTAQEDSHEDTL